MLLWTAVASAWAVAAAQPPQLASAGVVNAASYAQPIAPGSIVSIFGKNLANGQASALSLPLPTKLAGTSVIVNGVAAPLFFVSPGQINFEAPSSLHYQFYTYTSATIVVTSEAGSSSPVQVPVYFSSPAIFTADTSGCGQAAALNITPDGVVSLNSPANSAAPGDFVSLYLTGMGLPDFSVADGNAASGPDPLQNGEGLAIGFVTVQIPSYAGLAPGLPGVDQANVQIPSDALQGCSVPVTPAAVGIQGPTATIAIHSGRGQCVDPPQQSYGSISITRTIASGTSTTDGETDTLAAAFPSGPALQRPAPDTVPPGSYSNGGGGNGVFVSRLCPVAGYSQLSAGSIQVSGAGASITAQPMQVLGGVLYQQPLPTGFLGAGEYAVAASGGPVTFQGQLSVPPPIQIQSNNLAPGTTISPYRPLTVTWTGGAPGTRVRLELHTEFGFSSPYDYAYAPGDAGSFSFVPSCSPNDVCSFLLPATSAQNNGAAIVVEYSADPDHTAAFSAQGLTGNVQASWVYRWVFDGLQFAQ